MTAAVDQPTDTYLLGARRAIAETIGKATTLDQLDAAVSSSFHMLAIACQYWPVDAVRATGLAYEVAFLDAHQRITGSAMPAAEVGRG